MNTTGFFKDGRSYEERTRSTLMDGEGYVTDLLNAQERTGPDHVHITNKMFNKFYKPPQVSKKTKYNKILNNAVKTSSPAYYMEQAFNSNAADVHNNRYRFKLDPSFMSCNSDYKTIALRGVFMKPKRYTLNYALELQVTPLNIPVSKDPPHALTMEYKKYFHLRNHYDKFIVEFTDFDGITYTIDYKQKPSENHRWKHTEVIEMKVGTNGQYWSKDNIAGNNASFIKYRIDNDDEHSDYFNIELEFLPHGYVSLYKSRYRYDEELDEYVHCYDELLVFERDRPWPTSYDKYGLVEKHDNNNCHVIRYEEYSRIINESKAYRKICPFHITLLPENSIEVFAHEVTAQINNQLKQDDAEMFQRCEMLYDYDNVNNTLVFNFEYNGVDEDDLSTVKARFKPLDEYKNRNDHITFNYILNQVDYPILPTPLSKIVFHDVWNREHFYIHASYMNVVQYNQLGRTGEIYPKPTKLTRYSSSSPDIEFWTSVNGIDPFPLVDQDFEVDVALAATLNNAEITF